MRVLELLGARLRHTWLRRCGKAGNPTAPSFALLVEQVIHETLRLYPVVWTGDRVPREDIELGGYAIPKSIVRIPVGQPGSQTWRQAGCGRQQDMGRRADGGTWPRSRG